MTRDAFRVLINHHSRRHLAGNVGGQFGGLFCLFTGLLPVDMRLQPLVEIVRAHASVDDSHDNENECDDREEGQRSSSKKILLESARLVHPDKLEEEIRHRAKIKELTESVGAGHSLVRNLQ